MISNDARRVETLETCFVASIGVWIGLQFPAEPPDLPTPVVESITIMGMAVQAIGTLQPDSPLATLFPAVRNPPEGLVRRVVAEVTSDPKMGSLGQQHRLIFLAYISARYHDSRALLEAVSSCNVMTMSLQLSRTFLKEPPSEHDQNSFGILYSLWTTILAVSHANNRTEVAVEAVERGLLLMLAKWTLRITDWRGRRPQILWVTCVI